MSDAISRAEMTAVIEAVRNTAFPLLGYQGGPIPPSPFVKMADAMAAALSASPPRVPVKSGPGQPIDLAEHFETRAQWHDKIGSTKAAADCRQAAAAIRALADKAPDALLPGLEYIAKKIDEHRYAFHSDVSAAEAHRAASIEYSTLVHREIAARKGG